ncbi:TIGR02117 family protein [soil metagenome]|jgi:uncharacterized protein (TIGR02117 family)
MVYQILIFLLSTIPVNRNFSPADNGIEIVVGTNNVHTEIILPVENELFNWRKLIPLDHFQGVDTSYHYMAIGWGDKGFYINTPTWDDLSLGIAMNALFLPSEAAIHITYIPTPPRFSPDYVSVRITESQYQKLLDYILPYFRTDPHGAIIPIPDAAFLYNENFFEALGEYTFLNTSNNWTNRALRRTGIRTALWSPLDAPIIHQLNNIERD